MKLRTLLLFATIGFLVAAPTLFSGAGQESRPPGTSSIGPTGDLSRMNPGTSIPSLRNQNPSPFRFAGSQGNQPFSQPVSTMGNNVATPSPVNGAPTVSYSEPVYQAFVSLAEFVRFDVSPDWVKSRWPRVSAFPDEDGLTGMRVALVSGPRPVDIHGSLTYYFDDHQILQRILFKGWTGDARELIHLVQTAGMTRQKTNGAGLFTIRYWGKFKGVLRLDHPPVVQKELPNEQLMVLMEIVNPDGNLNLSRQTTAILNAMEQSK